MPDRPAVNERSHVELITIHEICRILGGSLDITRTFRAALNVLVAHIGLTRAMVVMPGGEAGDGPLSVHSSVGLDREQEQRGQWRIGEGVIGRVYASGLPVVMPDITQAPEFIDRTGAFGAQGERMMAFLVVPLKTDHDVVGVLAAQRFGGQEIGVEDRAFVAAHDGAAQRADLEPLARGHRQTCADQRVPVGHA